MAHQRPYKPAASTLSPQRTAIRATRPYAHAIAALLILGACVAIFYQTRSYGLLGWDTYPIIVTSRVQSLADLVRNFTDELMAGRYESDFYRPLLSLTFAIDYALWGTSAAGYQLTDVLLFGACAAALYALMRRLAGSGARVAPFVTLIYFLVHPLHFEVIPVPARRADVLCSLFMALSLWAQLSPKSLVMRRPPLVPAIFTLLAVASKESALLLPALSFLVVSLYVGRPTVRGRLVRAVVAVAPHVAVVAIAVGVRYAVLGGLGGHRSVPVALAASKFPFVAYAVAEMLLFPQLVMVLTPAAVWLTRSTFAALALTGVLMLIQRRATRARPGTDRHLVRAAVVGLGWLLLLTLVYSAAGRFEAWYLHLPVAGFALTVGAIVDGLWTSLKKGLGPLRLAAAASLLLLCALLAWHVRYSPLVQRYPEWDQATAATNAFFEDLRARIDAAPDGTIIGTLPMPVWVEPREDAPAIRGAGIVSDYSVQAWADLTFPHRRVRVVDADAGPIKGPAPDEIVVLVARRTLDVS